MSIFKRKRLVFLTTKGLFTMTLIVIGLTISLVYFQGLLEERSVLKNSILSTLLLSGFLFLFMTVALYKGVKLKDNLGQITDTFDTKKFTVFKDWFSPVDMDLSLGDGIEGVIGSIIAWILASIIIGIVITFLGAFIWLSILLLLAILYWIFYRGLRLVFKKSPISQGDLLVSLKYSSLYTLGATAWLIVLLFIAEHKNNTFEAFASLFK
jgi:hypothetical protein